MAQYVATKFRTHPLSFIRGGATIIIETSSRDARVYDKVKYPLNYISAALAKSTDIENIYVNNELVWSAKEQLPKQELPKQRKLVPLSSYRKAA